MPRDRVLRLKLCELGGHCTDSEVVSRTPSYVCQLAIIEIYSEKEEKYLSYFAPE